MSAHPLFPSCRSACLLLAVASAALGSTAIGQQNIQFVGFTQFTSFSRVTNQDGSLTLTSPSVTTAVPWDQLVPSWNLRTPQHSSLQLAVTTLHQDGAQVPFAFGAWNLIPGKHLGRRSPSTSPHPEGRVATDTLILNRPASRFQAVLRLTPPDAADHLTFLGFSLVNSRIPPPVLPPNRRAWGRELAVPERSQMPYPDGVMLCSPAAVSMLTGFWAWLHNRPEWDLSVPDIALRVWDHTWAGTGNWSFNMAYVGSKTGLRAYVARFADLAQVEDCVAAGVPVALSLCYNKLRNKPGEPSGHLVVCTGFTTSGEVILNDPGTTLNVRKVFPRQNVLQAWDNSRRTVYLVYPEDSEPPQATLAHWLSPTFAPN